MHNSSDHAARQLMAQRYGAASPRNQRLVAALSVLLALALLVWLVWAAWSHATPDVSGELQGYQVVSAHEVTVTLQVRRAGREAVVCTVQAQAVDHTVVGEDAVTVPAGAAGDVTFEATLRTDREATTATVSGCH